jgi:hypothetical protein
MLAYCNRKEESLVQGGKASQPDEQDTAREPALAEDQLAKVLARRHQQICLLVGQLQHNIIRDAWLRLGDITHYMTVLSQAIYDLAIDALVGKESHLTVSATG